MKIYDKIPWLVTGIGQPQILNIRILGAFKYLTFAVLKCIHLLTFK